MQGFRREGLADILPPVDGEVNEAPRRPTSVLNLLILSIFLPLEVVRIVELTVGWPELTFGNREGGEILHIDPVDNLRELARLVRALRDIGSMNWTSDCRYAMQNFREYKILLGRLLSELNLCRELRLPPRALNLCREMRLPPRALNLPRQNGLPEPDQNELIRYANALEALVEELDLVNSRHGTQSLILLDQFDQHIISVHQLIEFLG